MNKIYGCFSSSTKKAHTIYKEQGEVSMSEVEAWYAKFRTQTTDRDMEIRNARFVKDKYGRRMACIVQPDVFAKEAEPSHTRFEGLQSASLRLVNNYGCGTDNTTLDTVIYSHTPKRESSRICFGELTPTPLRLTKMHGAATNKTTHDTMADLNPLTNDVGGSRDDPVRLSCTTTVTRMSTREKRDRRRSNTRSLAENSLQNTITQPTKDVLLVPRRFSFDEDSELAFSTANQQEMVGLPHIRMRFPIRTSIHTPTIQPYKGSPPIPRSHSSSLLSSKEQQEILWSSSDTHYHGFVSIDLSSPQLPRDVAGKKAISQNVTQDVGVKQRRIPTTFDEILGKRKVPTALL